MSDGGEILRELGQGRYRIEHPLAVNARDGSVMVYVPEGEFTMGDGKDKDCPKHRATLSAYWIGVYAVTNAQYLRFVETTGHRVPDHSDWNSAPAIWKGRGFPPEKADHPVVCVSWDDATAYAKWSGCALPTEAQWEKAARGPGGLIYPWGNDWDANKCRQSENHGNEMTSAVSGYPQGVSEYGTYGQSGNVWEWCADWYDSGYYAQSPARDPRRGPKGSSDLSRRGGCWWLNGPASVRGARRSGCDPGNGHADLGFRLVRPLSGPLPS